MESLLPRETKHLAFPFASARFILAFFSIAIAPLVYPPLMAHQWLFLSYAAIASVEMWLIWKDIGGVTRVLIASVLDLGLVTFLVQRVGSAQTMLVSLYFVTGIINTLVVGPSIGMILSVIAAVMFSTVIALEVLHVLPYAPDAYPPATRLPLDALDGAIVAGMFSLLLIASSALVALLVRIALNRQRELVGANKQLEGLTRQDPLTKLSNRRHIMDEIENGLAWLTRGRLMSLVMIDLDQFKKVNDEQGHLMGDELLRVIAGALADTIRKVDMVGRYGGDEFLILLPDTDREHGMIAAQRFVDAVRSASARLGERTQISASAGLTVARAGDTVNSLIRRADQNAYAAKKRGGNCVVG